MMCICTTTKGGTVTQKVIKAGDRLAVTLPNDVVEALQLQEGSQVSLKLTADRCHAMLTLGTTPATEIDPVFAQQVAEFIDQYRPALEALAK
jgi:antitoxin component of MazEF toxin-antitoxin module